MTFPQLLLLASALSLIALLVWQRNARRRSHEVASLSRRGGPFHCVAVRPRGKACVAVRALQGHRFLAGEAPNIPVPGCTSAVCRCGYVHFDDRRLAERRNPYRPPPMHHDDHQAPNRRARRDRRRDPRLLTREAA